jgi:hypothetical protein
MITVKGLKVIFTGKDAKQFKSMAKQLGLTPQEALTGLLWEKVIDEARKGAFVK